MAIRAFGPGFTISFPAGAHAGPITGRVYVAISKTNDRAPIQQTDTTGVPLFGVNVDALAPGALPLHLGDRGLDDAGDCPAPAGVRGGDNARLKVGEQHGRRVGRGLVGKLDPNGSVYAIDVSNPARPTGAGGIATTGWTTNLALSTTVNPGGSVRCTCSGSTFQWKNSKSCRD